MFLFPLTLPSFLPDSEFKVEAQQCRGHRFKGQFTKEGRRVVDEI
jgi:hypothetical protein